MDTRNNSEEQQTSGKSGLRLPISCFIIAKNEEARIGRTIEAVIDWVDEVIVVDSGSTDRTEEVCRSLGTRFIHNDWPGYGPQKRFGEEQCRNDWVFNLDADEVVTTQLQDEIVERFQSGDHQCDGYSLYVVDMLPGRTKPLPLARKYNIVRLYNWKKMRYSESLVHDRVVSEGHSIGQLNNLVQHYSILSISQTITKVNDYSDLQMKVMKPRPTWLLRLRLLIEFPYQFLRYFIMKGLFVGGFQGLSYAMVYASSRFFRIAKALEKQQKTNPHCNE